MIRFVLRRCAALVVLAIAFVPVHVGAQSASLVGSVLTDPDEKPLANAEVILTKQKLSARSDANGNFQISGIAAGKQDVTIRMVGYEPVLTSVTFADGQKVEADFMLRAAITKLDKVDVKANVDSRYTIRLQDFERRRKFGNGRFLTSEVFEKAEGQNLSQVLVSSIPGIRTVGKSTEQILVARRGSTCALQVIVNGLVRFNGTQPNFNVNDLFTSNVLGVEYYSLPNTPAEFTGSSRMASGIGMPAGFVQGGANCGTIVIWTK